MKRFRIFAGNDTVLAILAAPLAAFVISLPVYADTNTEIMALLEAKRYDDALEKAAIYIQENPHDPQIRFLQGVSMARAGRTSDAIAVFTALTTDFPELAEPHNNLAVLYAAEGNFENARAALEKAIHADPGYATAYENLGDIYLQLATRAYAKAVQLSPDNDHARRRQSLLSGIDAQMAGTTSPATTRTSGVFSPLSEKEVILETVNKWAAAWSAKDVAAYLRFYAADFRLPKKESRTAWEEKRRTLIEEKKRIEVKVESPQVSLSTPYATVSFRQIYASERHSSKERKTLVLRKDDREWKIIEERIGN